MKLRYLSEDAKQFVHEEEQIFSFLPVMKNYEWNPHNGHDAEYSTTVR